MSVGLCSVLAVSPSAGSANPSPAASPATMAVDPAPVVPKPVVPTLTYTQNPLVVTMWDDIAGVECKAENFEPTVFKVTPALPAGVV